MLRRGAGRGAALTSRSSSPAAPAPASEAGTLAATEIRIGGVVQGVGFRPFAYRLAARHGIAGWVLNGEHGVRIHAEGGRAALEAFAQALVDEAPPAAAISTVEIAPVQPHGFEAFAIVESTAGAALSAPISPDLPVCEDCLRELFDPADRRYRYPYITCTNCGPRYSIVTGLPYDRPRTTMAEWPMCEACAREYHDPGDRRFHAQPLACPQCGPTYVLRTVREPDVDPASLRDRAAAAGAADEPRGTAAIERAALLLREGAILAVKGIGGYHLACDAANPFAVAVLRERKYRKERPFALMARDEDVARELVELDEPAATLLRSPARPIVLARARRTLAGVAPDNRELGVMLPYAPLHHLLFALGAPDVLVMTSANRSSEPMEYDDAAAARRLAALADAFLAGERAIARRVDDSVARSVASGPQILRRARGTAPQAVASLPAGEPLLAAGGDLKNAVALVVDGQAFVSQHVGDLAHLAAREAFETTIGDLCATYGLDPSGLVIAHDAHPEYVSTALARAVSSRCVPVQHHRAHVASVLAERGELERDVLGIAFDGTGYGDDGAIWGGEVFRGSVARGFARVAHLRSAALPGGDASARFPVQAAAGFLANVSGLPDLTAPPFAFPQRYEHARAMIAKNVRTFATTSMGRLFDTVAALLGFTREITFEGQAAMWVEHLAGSVPGDLAVDAYAFPLHDAELDYRPLLAAIVEDRGRGADVPAIARRFHLAVRDAIVALRDALGSDEPLVVSGGVFQNRLLLELLHERLGEALWANARVPANDGGLSLGQAALASFAAR